jgi:uncharacterized membrane protein HdeD (DUF308 family)
MSTRVLEFEDFVRNNLGKIMIGSGILAVIFGIFMLDSLGTLASASSLFLGVLLIVYGFFVQVGLLSVEWRSINGIATVLLCISVGFFALAIVALQFQIVYAEPVREVFHGALMPFMRLKLTASRPFVYLFALGSQIGLVLFTASIALKIFSHFRH